MLKVGANIEVIGPDGNKQLTARLVQIVSK
jgi:hypothetical protein